MNVLVVGGGGREHALAWKLRSEPCVAAILCAPGNPGIASVARNVHVPVSDCEGLAALAEREHIDLTIVGPELPLDAGIVDLFRSRGLSIFGPSQAAAQLECSKVFAKTFMARHGIPTARYRVCDTAADAHATVASGELGFPIVVKADGLAAGKGVVVAPDRAEADLAIRAAMEDKQFGRAGARIVLEECLDGPEVSFFAICDGTRASALMSAQDHKRVFDGDEGPNTGGMGAFAPTPLVDQPMQTRILREIVNPVVAGLSGGGLPHFGFFFAGMVVSVRGPKVIEFNVRFGDPEAQVVIPMIADELAPRLAAAAAGALDPRPIAFRPEPHVGVVLASRGYPSAGPMGVPIHGLDRAAEERDVLLSTPVRPCAVTTW